MNLGFPDIPSYYTAEAFAEGFKKCMAFQPRVVKQNRGSAGEGIWIIKLRSTAIAKGSHTSGELQHDFLVSCFFSPRGL